MAFTRLALTAKVAQPMITPIRTSAMNPTCTIRMAMASREAYSGSEMRRTASISHSYIRLAPR